MHELLKDMFLREKVDREDYIFNQKKAEKFTTKSFIDNMNKKGIASKDFIETMKIFSQLNSLIYLSKKAAFNENIEKIECLKSGIVLNHGLILYTFSYYQNFYNNFTKIITNNNFDLTVFYSFVQKEVNNYVWQKNCLMENLENYINIYSFYNSDYNNKDLIIQHLLKIALDIRILKFKMNTEENMSINIFLKKNNLIFEYILYQFAFLLS